MTAGMFKPDQMVSAPPKQGEGRRWWVRILDMSDNRHFAKVKGGKANSPPYWVDVTLLLTKAEMRARAKPRMSLKRAKAAVKALGVPGVSTLAELAAKRES